MAAALEPLFAYGSLQRADVQCEQIGRMLDGTADALSGFRMGRIAIGDAEVVRRSGETHYPVLAVDAAASQRVAGTLYWLTKDELAAADAYEAEDYERRHVTLESGRAAWVYVASPGLEME